jgi:hypothetical protein
MGGCPGEMARLYSSASRRALLRLAWIFAPGGGLDGDEAVFGLMALHILDGRDYPIFCWGVHYADAVVSYIAAAGYQIFGISGAVLKSATLPFAVGYLAVTYGLVRIVFDDRTARIALLLAAIPPALPLDFSVKTTGGYPEPLCFGGLVLLLAFRLPGEEPSLGALRWHLLLLGFVRGVRPLYPPPCPALPGCGMRVPGRPSRQTPERRRMGVAPGRRLDGCKPIDHLQSSVPACHLPPPRLPDACGLQE